MSNKSSAGTNRVDLSVIIINWNTKELTAQCLCSIADNLTSSSITYEVVVVDNASSDGSPQMIRDEFSWVKLICNDENLGYVRANNQAAAQVQGRYYLLLNSDTQLLDQSMPKIIEYLDIHPHVAVATGKVLNPDRTFQSPYRRFPTFTGALYRHTIGNVRSFNTSSQKRHKYEDLDPDKVYNVDSVTGAYLFIRGKVVESNKVFDEDIFMYYEDTLLCYRMHTRGYQVVYLPYAPIIHYHGMSARKARPEATFNSFMGSTIYIKKVYGEKSAVCYAKIVGAIWRMLNLGFALLCIFPIPKFREKATFFRSLVKKEVTKTRTGR